jgi:hypothetical protein
MDRDPIHAFFKLSELHPVKLNAHNETKTLQPFTYEFIAHLSLAMLTLEANYVSRLPLPHGQGLYVLRELGLGVNEFGGKDLGSDLYHFVGVVIAAVDHAVGNDFLVPVMMFQLMD